MLFLFWSALRPIMLATLKQGKKEEFRPCGLAILDFYLHNLASTYKNSAGQIATLAKTPRRTDPCFICRASDCGQESGTRRYST